MDFKTQKIRESSPEKPTLSQKENVSFFQEIKKKNVNKTQNKIPKLSINVIVVLLIFCIMGISYGIYKTISQIDYSIILKAAGTKLLTDAEGQTNFLILGIGGKNHDGGDLTDSIMIASLDQKSKTVSMASFPRDIYVKDETVGNSKINEVYYYAKKYFDDEKAGLEFFKSKIETLTNTEIQYYIMIDFKGFKEIVDTIGGIEVNVENDIYDTSYPKDGTHLYETFSIKKGLQHLDGETALKYARSRKTTSDFDRSSRQQQIIYAIKEKAISIDTIFSSEKISDILDSLKENLITNISIGEMLTIGAISKDYKQENITHHLLHDDPNTCGGLLYTPLREDYNNLFVLLPAGGNTHIYNYFDLILNYPEINTNEKIHILNGTKTAGIAGETKQVLNRYCFDINRFGNGRNQEIKETTYFYKEKLDENGQKIEYRPSSLNFLEKIIPGKESTDIPEEYLEYITDTDIILEIGSDYTNSKNYLEDPFYTLILNTPTATTATIESNTTPN